MSLSPDGELRGKVDSTVTCYGPILAKTSESITSPIAYTLIRFAVDAEKTIPNWKALFPQFID
jgi:hypothetical protein